MFSIARKVSHKWILKASNKNMYTGKIFYMCQKKKLHANEMAVKMHLKNHEHLSCVFSDTETAFLVWIFLANNEIKSSSL